MLGRLLHWIWDQAFEVGGLRLIVRAGRYSHYQWYELEESSIVRFEASQSAICPTCGHLWREARADTAAVNRLS